jgi:uncharacterized tellurite resistance protein B-like protein
MKPAWPGMMMVRKARPGTAEGGGERRRSLHSSLAGPFARGPNRPRIPLAARGLVMPFALLEQIRSIFEGDPGVRKVADDPVLSAELLMLFRMILADGTVSESEMKAFRRICSESFGIPEASIERVIDYLNDFGYETKGSQAIALFRDLDIGRRRQLARHMAEIAKADHHLAENEVRLLRRTLDILQVSPADVVKGPDE